MSDSWLNPGLVIASPFLAGTARFAIERRRQVVDIHGRAQITTTWLRGLQGIITPAGAPSIDRQEAFQQEPKGITVVTRTRLYGVSRDVVAQSFQPDRIHWHGDVFQVVTLQDATGYGPGYVVATCNSIDYTDAAPPA